MARKVLVIDDTAVIREFLEEVLSDSGFEVDSAENGQIGYEMALKSDYAIIFSDVHMPMMNGLEMVRKIRKIKPDTPIIITDSYPDKLAEEATRAGATSCLAKPFSLQELRQTIHRIIADETEHQ
jgi:CheY-like chemotaxis protein